MKRSHREKKIVRKIEPITLKIKEAIIHLKSKKRERGISSYHLSLSPTNSLSANLHIVYRCAWSVMARSFSSLRVD